jgi:predicted RNA-binding Zn-ribbon protein involved in translation (DUF1610 family)
MPAFQLSRTRTRRPLTCDACNKKILPIAVVTICTHCKHMRHIDCSKLPCPHCGSMIRRTAVYRTGKILRYF